MVDTYVFTVIIEDSADEFSEEFNPKDKEQKLLFEQEIKEVIENHSPLFVRKVILTKVEIDL